MQRNPVQTRGQLVCVHGLQAISVQVNPLQILQAVEGSRLNQGDFVAGQVKFGEILETVEGAVADGDDGVPL